MKIFDCTTYYNEDLILEVRFNILNKYVDKFLITEAKYSHSGEKKKLNFNINKFSEFKKKITYVAIDNEPKNIIYQKKNNTFFENVSDMRTNGVRRINYQRDRLMDGLSEANTMTIYCIAIMMKSRIWRTLILKPTQAKY